MDATKCKFKDCDNDADKYCFNPEVHWRPVGLCDSCLNMAKAGIPYTVSYYDCGVRKDIVALEFRHDVPVQIGLYNFRMEDKNESMDGVL